MSEGIVPEFYFAVLTYFICAGITICSAWGGAPSITAAAGAFALYPQVRFVISLAEVGIAPGVGVAVGILCALGIAVAGIVENMLEQMHAKQLVPGSPDQVRFCQKCGAPISG
jgi:hypothetical protein